jgi:hypothetical protein
MVALQQRWPLPSVAAQHASSAQDFAAAWLRMRVGRATQGDDELVCVTVIGSVPMNSRAAGCNPGCRRFKQAPL